MGVPQNRLPPWRVSFAFILFANLQCKFGKLTPSASFQCTSMSSRKRVQAPKPGSIADHLALQGDAEGRDNGRGDDDKEDSAFTAVLERFVRPLKD